MECLLFDFGGTLDSDGLTWLDRFRVIYKEAGVNVTPERLDRAFYDADDNLAARHELPGLTLEQTVMLQVEDVLGAVAPHRIRELAPAVAGAFVDGCRAHLRRNRPILERLSRRYRLGIVSNWYGNMDSILAGEGLSELFPAVADSAVVGAIKPSPEIFRAALAKLGGAPERAIMVGDNVKRDMRGAEGLGMRHVLLSTSPAPCCARGVTIRSLLELESALSAVPA